MLVRSRSIRHPSGTSFRTPLLLPSFSSKGLGFTTSGKSALRPVFATAAEYLTDAMLVSAYDVYHGHLPKLRSAIAAITFVDSGGYETSDFQDLSAAFVQRTDKKDWNESLLKETLDSWSDRIPAVFVAYDRHAPIVKQIKAARRLLRQYPKQLTAILLKPRTANGQKLSITDITANAGDLVAFDVIGVTEKELGSSMIERME